MPSVPMLVAIAVGPALVLVHLVYAVDRHKEPLRNILRYFVAGALIIIPAALLEISVLGLARRFLGDPTQHSLLVLLCFTFFGVALVEEVLKRIALHICAVRDRHLDEAFDWIVYAVAVAMGFALVENLFYVVQGGLMVGVLRALTAVPAHGLNGTLMGDRLARAHFGGAGDTGRQRRLSIIEPTFWHGVYDFCALGVGAEAQRGRPRMVLALGLMLFLVIVIQWAIAVQRVMRWRAASRPTAVPPPFFPLEVVRRITTRRGPG